MTAPSQAGIHVDADRHNRTGARRLRGDRPGLECREVLGFAELRNQLKALASTRRAQPTAMVQKVCRGFRLLDLQRFLTSETLDQNRSRLECSPVDSQAMDGQSSDRHPH